MPRKFQGPTTFDELNSCTDEQEVCDDPISVPDVDATAVLVGSLSPCNSSVCEGEDKSEHRTEDDEDLKQDWYPSLYMLQAHSPKAKCVKSIKKVEVLSYYGLEYHGYLNRQETEQLLGCEDGSYLIRDTLAGVKILSFMMNKRMYNYKLLYEDGQHFIGENRFEEINDLVQDNLITLYLQQHNVAKTMHEGQMMSILRKKTARKKLHGLQRSHGKRVKGLKGKKAWEYQHTISASSISSVQSPSPTPSPTHSPSPTPERNSVNIDSTFSTHLDFHRYEGSNPDESSLDVQNGITRKSTPDLHKLSSSTPNYSEHARTPTKRTDSTSSLPSSGTYIGRNNRYSVIVSTLREAVNEDKRREQLKLDKSVNRLKPCSSEGRIGQTATLQSGKISPSLLSDEDDRPIRAYSCHIPYSTQLQKIADVSSKGTNVFSKGSVEALAKHTSGPKSPYFKAHNFAPHTYIGPTWCEICHHYLWGLKHQGLRCKDCGMDIHKQCLPLCLRLECYPNKQFVKRVFGVDLTTLVKLEGKIIPSILSDCIKEIESREKDLSSTGIYRLSGQTSEIIYLKEKYDSGDEINLSQYLDVSILTGVVKLYLRELPIPLITFDVYQEVIKVTASIDDPEDKQTDWSVLKNVIKLLPKAHYNTMEFLMKHLYKIHLLAAENKMNAHNLAVVFAPTLMKSPSEGDSLINDLSIQKSLIEYMILYHNSIFE